MYTGAMKVDTVAKIRFNNDKDYVNRMMPINDGFNYTNVQVPPTKSSDELILFRNSTFGM
jgi:hypothetical protein